MSRSPGFAPFLRSARIRIDSYPASFSCVSKGLIPLSIFIMLRFEAVVNFYLIPCNQAIGFVRHTDYRHQFFELRIGHPFMDCGSGMRSDAIVALVGHGEGNVNDLFGERIERSGSHNLLYIFPSPLQHHGVMRDCLPEITDPVRLARRHDVVVNGANFSARVSIFDKAKDRHRASPIDSDFQATTPNRALCSMPPRMAEATACRCKGRAARQGMGSPQMDYRSSLPQSIPPSSVPGTSPWLRRARHIREQSRCHRFPRHAA